MSKQTPTVADGDAWRTLQPSGLIVLRRQKHEWFPALARLPGVTFRERTNKLWGSKFNDRWPPLDVVDFIEKQVTLAAWTADVQEPEPLDVYRTDPVGYVNGDEVHTVRIVCDGKYVHAYPVEDPE